MLRPEVNSALMRVGMTCSLSSSASSTFRRISRDAELMSRPQRPLAVETSNLNHATPLPDEKVDG